MILFSVCTFKSLWPVDCSQYFSLHQKANIILEKFVSSRLVLSRVLVVVIPRAISVMLLYGIHHFVTDGNVRWGFFQNVNVGAACTSAVELVII